MQRIQFMLIILNIMLYNNYMKFAIKILKNVLNSLPLSNFDAYNIYLHLHRVKVSKHPQINIKFHLQNHSVSNA